MNVIHHNKQFYVNVAIAFDTDAAPNPLRRPEEFHHVHAGELNCVVDTRMGSFVSAAPARWQLTADKDGDDKLTRQHLSDCFEQLVEQLNTIKGASSYIAHPRFAETLPHLGPLRVNAQLYYLNGDHDLAWGLILKDIAELAQNEHVTSELKHPHHWTQRLGLFDLNERAAAFSHNGE